MEGHHQLSKKKFKKAEKLLLQALNAKGDTLEYRHLIYNALIDLYYRLRDERNDALERCVFFCKKDIEILPVFLKREKEEYGVVPRCPSVIKLSIIYEKQKRYKEAIEVCELALENDLLDGTKAGFAGRIERIKKKLYH